MANYQSTHTGAEIDQAVSWALNPYTDVADKITLNGVYALHKYATLDAGGWVKFYLNGMTTGAFSSSGTEIATLDASIAPSDASGARWPAAFPSEGTEQAWIEHGKINYYGKTAAAGAMAPITLLMMWKVAT